METKLPTSLEKGIELTYNWINQQVKEKQNEKELQ